MILSHYDWFSNKKGHGPRDKHAQREGNVKGPTQNAIKRLKLYNATNQGDAWGT